MNIFQFLWLIYEIYVKKGPVNLEKIQSLGLLAVKIGQVHALRIDFLDPEKCKQLTELYRNTTPIPQEAARALMDTRIDTQKRAQFSSIDPQPFASASIGQIHKGVLTSGEQVAVKLVKKDFKETFIRDVARVQRLFQWIIFFYPKLDKVGNPLGILDHIREYTLEELDLRNEIKGQHTLHQIADQHRDVFDLSKLVFPHIYQDLSGENVMVTEYVDAPTFDELLESRTLPYERLLDLFYIHGFYMFLAGTFHGDIHPGNIMLKDEKIYFIDTGAISHVSEQVRKNLFWFFEALSRYDYPNCAHFLNEMAEKKIEGERYSVFQEKFLELYAPFTGKTVSEVSLTRQMMYTIKLGVDSGMVFERGIFAIIKSLMYLDGMVMKCKPDAILMEDMRHFVEAYKKHI